MGKNKVAIELSNDEAIVLFGFLTRLNERGNEKLFEDQAEQRVLWDVESILEKQLSEPFRADYLEILLKARDSVRDKQ